MSYSVGDRFWVPDEEHAWIVGILKEFKSGVLEFQTDKAGIKKFRVNDLKHKLEPCGSHIDDHVENLVDLDELSEGAILHHVRNRFLKKVIYTHVGSILVAVNPFENLPIYGERDIRRAFEATSPYPHVFVTAAVAYQQLQANRKNQSILISGESGAGKTETTKKVLTFLANVAPDSKPKVPGEPGMETKILQSNPLLEALGNAKTLRNNNSSRFGKWMKVGFNSMFLIQGCEIINYLLEKSRVVHQSLNERNYHIFYQLIAGADNSMKQRLYLKNPDEYNYLQQSQCFTIPGVDDEQEFQDVLEAMKTLQFSNSTIESMFKIIAGILLLGNIQFEPIPTNGDAAEVCKSSQEIAMQCAELLGLELDVFLFALQEKRVQMGKGSIVSMKFSVSQAIDNRDTLSKSLYSNMFDWTIQRVNSTLKTEGESQFSIGILDIFGFEVFEVNSFEQLCINYANEKLQYHFNEVIFHEEKIMYQDEGISLEEIVFEDNADCVNLIEGKPYGLISLLEEECSLGNGTDQSYASKIEKTFVANKSTSNKYFLKNKVKPECFSVMHFAGPVEYNVTNFLDKNRDTLNVTVKEAMMMSKIPLIADLFTDKEDLSSSSTGNIKTGGGGNKDKNKTKSTLGGQFRNQLIGLITNLRLTEPHFIRCVKPNHQKVGHLFDGQLALRQLKYAGLFEAIRIRKSGYAYRANFNQFANAYQILVDGLMFKRQRNQISDREACEEILTHLTKQSMISNNIWKVGLKSKVFLKNNSDRLILEKDKNTRTLVFILRIQKFIRLFLTKLFYQREMIILKKEKLKIEELKRKQITSTILLQKNIRRFLVMKNMKSMKYLIELRKIIKRREIYKIKDILMKIDEEMKILKAKEEQMIKAQQLQQQQLLKEKQHNLLLAVTGGGGGGGSKSKSNNPNPNPSQPTPMEMRTLLSSAKKAAKGTGIEIPAQFLPDGSSTGGGGGGGTGVFNNPVSTILAVFEHEIKIAKIMYKLFDIQETLIHDLTIAIQKNNIIALNSLILKSERLEMNNHPIVMEAKELIISLYHKRKIIQNLLKFLLNHQNEFNEKEIENNILEAKKMGINPEFVNKIQLIYDNAGPRLKTRNRLRMNIEMINRYGIEQGVLEVLQIRTHHESFGESELRAARSLLQLLEYDGILYPHLQYQQSLAAVINANLNNNNKDNNNHEIADKSKTPGGGGGDKQPQQQQQQKKKEKGGENDEDEEDDEEEKMIDVHDLPLLGESNDSLTLSNVPFASGANNNNNNHPGDPKDSTPPAAPVKPTLLWGKPILTESTGPLLTPEVIEICNAITESTFPAIVKMHKQRLQQIAGSVERVYQIIRYYKWMKVLCTWKYPEVVHANSTKTPTDPFFHSTKKEMISKQMNQNNNNQANGKKSSIFEKATPEKSIDGSSDFQDYPGGGGGGGVDGNGEPIEEFFGLKFQEAHCNPYIIRLLHQDFDIYGQRTHSAMMEAALSAIDLPSSMAETLENLDLLNDIDKPILLPNGNIYQKTINNKNHKLFATDQININANIQNNLLKTITPNKKTNNPEKTMAKQEKLLSSSYKRPSAASVMESPLGTTNTPFKNTASNNHNTRGSGLFPVTPTSGNRSSSMLSTTGGQTGASSSKKKLEFSGKKDPMQKYQKTADLLSMSLTTIGPDQSDNPHVNDIMNANTFLKTRTKTDDELTKELESSRKNRKKEMQSFEKEMKRYKSVPVWK